MIKGSAEEQPITIGKMQDRQGLFLLNVGGAFPFTIKYGLLWFSKI